MELIDRYVSEVGKRLWKRNRKDIEKELKSTLQDMLEEKVGEREVKEEDVVELLKEYGNPKEVASRYNNPDKYIIGPKVFDLYILVLKIALAVILLLILAGSILSFVLNKEANILIELLSLIASLMSAGVGVFGTVTLVFAIIEHYSDEDIEIYDEEWNPKDLPKSVKENDRVNILGTVVKILLILFTLIIFNVFPERIPVFFQSGGDWIFVSALNKEALNVYLPYWNILWILTLVFSFYITLKGKWDLKSKIIDIVLMTFSVFILALMIKGPDLIGLDKLQNMNPELAKELMPVLNILGTMLKVSFGIVIILILLDIVKKCYKMMRERV